MFGKRNDVLQCIFFKRHNNPLLFDDPSDEMHLIVIISALRLRYLVTDTTFFKPKTVIGVTAAKNTAYQAAIPITGTV
jgi:hypothetical protein